MIPWDIAHMPAPEDFEILCARMQLRSSEDGRFTVGSSHGCVEYGVASDWEPGVELEEAKMWLESIPGLAAFAGG